MTDLSSTSPNLAITAQYTAGVWAWAKFPCAELLADRDSARVFALTNAALALTPGTPLRYALQHRHAMLDRLARQHAATPGATIVELAAGLSPRGAAMTADPAVRYVELDLPHMVAHKRRLLARTDAGRAVLARANFTAVAADLAAFELESLAAVAHGPIFVIAEGLLMYLDRAARARLFGNIARLAAGARSLDFAFDLVPTSEQPRPHPLIGRALAAAMKRFTRGGGFVRDAATRAQICDELHASGLVHATAIAARDVARAWSLPAAERATPTVIFTARSPRSVGDR